jgi:hypothetical protein
MAAVTDSFKSVVIPSWWAAAHHPFKGLLTMVDGAGYS